MRVPQTGPIVASILTALALSGACAVAALAAEAESKEARIERAMRAAPSAVSSNATIIDVDGTVLRAGSSAWHCHPGTAPGDDHPMCNDGVWSRLMKALADKSAFQTDRVGISYMLEGDANVSNSDPFSTDPNDGTTWVAEGPHLMIVFPDPKMLEAFPDDPNAGGPYVMWKGTPYAHLMVPVAPRTAAK